MGMPERLAADVVDILEEHREMREAVTI